MSIEHIGWVYEATAQAMVDEGCVRRLKELALAHYDASARAMANVGGMLHGWSNRIVLEKLALDGRKIEGQVRVEVEIKYRDLDLLCKILESEPLTDVPRYAPDFRNLLRKLGAERERLNMRNR